MEQDSSNYKEKELIKNGAAEEEWKEINKEEDHPDLRFVLHLTPILFTSYII